MSGYLFRKRLSKTTMHSVRSVRKGGTMMLMTAALAGTSCTTDVHTALTIEQAQFAKSTATGCDIPVGRSQIFLIEGLLDVDLDQPYPYTMYPLIRSNMATSVRMGTVEVNNLQMTGMAIKLVPPPGVVFPSTPACPTEFDTRLSFLLKPNSEITGLVDVIQPCQSTIIRGMFMANALPNDPSARVIFTAVVRAKATHGESEIESAPFEFPIRVCMGCLQQGFNVTGFVGFDYPNTPTCSQLTANPFPGNKCNPAQDDGPILCCDTGNQAKPLDCPARPMPAPVAP